MGRLFSKKSLDGYVMVDHRDSPGVTWDDRVKMKNAALPVGKGVKFEGSTFTCSKCQRVVVKNPGRTRSRGYCRKCDHDVCDDCALLLHLNHLCTFDTCWHVKQVHVT
jgi:hypothetical protein